MTRATSLVQISFTTSSKGPDEDQLYPYYFHLVPSLSNAALAIANFVSYCEFDWNRAVIVTQDEDNYKRVLYHYCPVFSL